MKKRYNIGSQLITFRATVSRSNYHHHHHLNYSYYYYHYYFTVTAAAYPTYIVTHMKILQQNERKFKSSHISSHYHISTAVKTHKFSLAFLHHGRHNTPAGNTVPKHDATLVTSLAGAGNTALVLHFTA